MSRQSYTVAQRRHSGAPALNNTQWRSGSVLRRGLTLLLVAAAHVLVLQRLDVGRIAYSNAGDAGNGNMQSYWVELRPAQNAVTLAPPELQEQKIEIAPPDISAALDDVDVTASFDPPRIDASRAVDVARYSAQAGLTPGLLVSVVVMLDVSATGEVGEIAIVRASGIATADLAAVAYAQSLRWIPGMADGIPVAARTTLTVTLGST